MQSGTKKPKRNAIFFALAISAAMMSVGESAASTLTVEYDVSLQQMTDYATNTTTAYASPIRHGSYSFMLGSPYSYVTTYPLVAADPGLTTISYFGSGLPLSYLSPVADLLDANAFLRRFGLSPASGSVTTTNFHRLSDNYGDGFAARVSSGSYLNFISAGYQQNLNLQALWGDLAAPGSDPFAVTSKALVDYLLQNWSAGTALTFSESFSVYSVLQLRYLEGTGYSGAAQITNVLLDNVSLRNTVPEPSTLWLAAVGLVAFIGRRAAFGAARRATIQ